MVVSRSSDGGFTWDNPVNVGPNVASSDKNWIVCDSYSASPFYGNCYIEWDNPNTGDGILMSTSSDGGLTWSAAIGTANHASGIGGQPLVQPNGTVVVPSRPVACHRYRSTDGGKTWSKPVTIANIQITLMPEEFAAAPALRCGRWCGNCLGSVGGCRFRSQCSTNDLVYSRSRDSVGRGRKCSVFPSTRPPAP